MSDPEWWRTFFPEIFTAIQEDAVGPERTVREVDLLERLLPLAPGSTILDVPCGDARIARELARRGHRVAGVDLSGPMLERGAAAAADAGLEVELRLQDMRELEDVERYDAAVCMWGSFGYFDAAGDAAFVAGVARGLVSGGRFAIEGHLAETLLPRFTPRGWSAIGDARLLEERTWDHETGRGEVDWTLVREGESREHHSSIRVYTFRELATLLGEAGFGEVRAFDAVTGEAFRLGARRALVVATL